MAQGAFRGDGRMFTVKAGRARHAPSFHEAPAASIGRNRDCPCRSGIEICPEAIAVGRLETALPGYRRVNHPGGQQRFEKRHGTGVGAQGQQRRMIRLAPGTQDESIRCKTNLSHCAAAPRAALAVSSWRSGPLMPRCQAGRPATS